MKNSTNIIGVLFAALSLLQACGVPSDETKDSSVKKEKNLNISILLDLSDRIDTTKHKNQTMQYYQRDLGYIRSITEVFTTHLKSKRVFFINDKIRVFIDPEPQSPEVNSLVQGLRYSFTKNTVKQSEVESLTNTYQHNATTLYEQALKDRQYDGSDIWNFFKRNVKDYCIDDNHSNILVILTDGYMFHKDSKYKNSNRSSYLTSKTIRIAGLNSPNYKDLIQKKDFGFITEQEGLEDLKVLVIGVNPNKALGNPYEGDIIEEYWEKWFKEMGISKSKSKIVQADLPANTNDLIKDFILKD